MHTRAQQCVRELPSPTEPVARGGTHQIDISRETVELRVRTKLHSSCARVSERVGPAVLHEPQQPLGKLDGSTLAVRKGLQQEVHLAACNV